MYAHLLLFEKKSTSTVFVRFLKSTFNFTRSCAFPKKAKFYALKMLKKQNLPHPKAAKLATLVVYGDTASGTPVVLVVAAAWTSSVTA